MGSTSTVSFIPLENLNFEIILANEFWTLSDFLPLTNNLTLNFLFNLNIGALTGPKILPSINFYIKFLNLIDSSSIFFSSLPVIIRDINL